ncbi:head-tail adaptor protein [Rhodovulum sp. BSW8]|uniref:phage head completion protein n=1 Tax=Rhodovulum sp. BSW8 TaxID=2259645 RepID=UPI000DE4B80D|nr:head-tail adaptor protein [Rhodovulum sp. BSW8]RBO54062.1 head-tail adaptor protein [Rhodovulum sp. BSW8]
MARSLNATSRYRAVLTEAVAFDRPSGVPDGYGGTTIEWVEAFACHAEFTYAKGDETVQAARLAGRGSYKVKINSSSQSRRITTDWRMRDTRRGQEWNIREVDAITDRAWVWLVVEAD